MGGSWFLRGEAAYADFDGLSAAFSGQKNQELVDMKKGCNLPCKFELEIERTINEAASASIDKEDYMVHAAPVY